MSELADPVQLIRNRVQLAISGLEEEFAEEALATGNYVGTLLKRAAAGEDVDREMAHVCAQLANWTWVGSNRVYAAIKAGVLEWADFAASFLGRLAADFVVEALEEWVP